MALYVHHNNKNTMNVFKVIISRTQEIILRSAQDLVFVAYKHEIILSSFMQFGFYR